MRFIYVMDPMCSWCYAFQDELDSFVSQFDSVNLDWVMGGLAPDSSEPMEQQMRQAIASYWVQIEQQTEVTFNHDFWSLNTPYRSTYAACRAVISAQALAEQGAEKMVKAIQHAYYKLAQNPSLQTTLVECASSIGFEPIKFAQVLESQSTEDQLRQHLVLTQQLQVRGFPALFYIDQANRAVALTLGYCTSEQLTQRFRQIHTRT